jgi:hypothetical protein
MLGAVVYREAAPHSPPSRRVRTLSLRRRGPAWRVAIGALCLAFFVAAYFVARTRATLVCTRDRPGAVGRCVGEDVMGTDDTTMRFDAAPRSVWFQDVMAGEDGSVTKMMFVSTLMQGSATNEPDARAFVAAYDAFVADGTRLRFERSIGPPLGWAWLLAVALSVACLWALRAVDETIRIAVDLDGDTLTVEIRRWLQRTPRTTVVDWTAIREIATRSPDGDEEGVTDLVASKDGEKGALVLCRVRDAQAPGAARELDAWIRAELDERRRRDDERRRGA